MADEERVHLGGDAVYDKDLLGGSANKGQGYVDSIETGALDEDEETWMPKMNLKQVLSLLLY